MLMRMGGAFEMLSMVAGRGEIMSMMNGAFEMLTTMMMDGAFALTDAAVWHVISAVAPTGPAVYDVKCCAGN